MEPYDRGSVYGIRRFDGREGTLENHCSHLWHCKCFDLVLHGLFNKLRGKVLGHAPLGITNRFSRVDVLGIVVRPYCYLRGFSLVAYLGCICTGLDVSALSRSVWLPGFAPLIRTNGRGLEHHCR